MALPGRTCGRGESSRRRREGRRCLAAAALFDPQQSGSKLEGSNHGPIRWLADTGCPADLIGLNDMTVGDIERIEQTTEPICFRTANGPVWANFTFPLQGMALMEEIDPYVMESIPAVLSIGRRSMLHG